MSNSNIAYPFDPTGAAVTNRVIGENQTISPPQLSDFHFIVPEAAPFFANTMEIVHLNTGRTLVMGVDWFPTHLFHDASLATARQVYGSVTFFDRTLAGAVRMSYQTLGGDWTLSASKILEILSNKLTNPRTTTWEQVADVPYQFPVVDHQWHLDDLVGASELVEVLGRIRDAIYASGEGGLQTHVADQSNPHNVTKLQVGLGDVQNYGVASVAQAQAGQANDVYLTPLRGAQMVQALIGQALNDHINNTSNPHNVSKAQIGLNNVQNYGVPTQTQAEQGVLDNLYMTPLRTKQAIDAQVLTPLTSHVSNTSNPHNVTKAQVGLGLVQNYGVADVTAARLGLADDLYMTPLGVREAILAQSSSAADHIGDTSNPHSVNKAQVGLGNVQNYGIATDVDASDALSNIVYMTPLRTRSTVMALVGTAFNQHINDSSNPHGTNKQQVGLGNVENYAPASLAQAELGSANNLYLTPAGARALFVALGGGGGGDLSAHIGNTNNPHNTTKEQVGLGNVADYSPASNADAIAGLANNRYMTPATTAAQIVNGVGQALTNHVDDQSNPHNVTASQIGAYSAAQVDSLLLNYLGRTAKAADSDKLEGRTYAEVVTEAGSNSTFPAVRALPGETWTKLGQVTVNANQMTGPQADIVADIVGGESNVESHSPIYRVHLKTRAPAWSTVTRTSNNSSDIQFGYIWNPATLVLELWVKSPTLRQVISVSTISEPIEFFNPAAEPTSTEPAGIVYIPEVAQGSGSGGAFSTPPPAGQVFFGSNTAAGYASGDVVEFLGVAADAGELAQAQAHVNNAESLYSNYVGYSALDDINANYQPAHQNNWVYETVSGELFHLNATPGFSAWVAPNARTHYTFEVKVDLEADAHARGIVVAQAEVGGKVYTLSAVRTLGGFADGVRKLFSVILNLGQEDEVVIFSTNTGLVWGDGVADADRAGTPFNQATVPADAHCLLKVVRDGNTLTVSTTNFGSASYVPAAEAVIDLSATTAVSMLTIPTTYGFCTFGPTTTGFLPMAAPERYGPVLEMESVALGTGTYNRYAYHYHDGAAWQEVPEANKPYLGGRLVYSDWNGALYKVGRNGALIAIRPEAYDRANPTYLIS